MVFLGCALGFRVWCVGFRHRMNAACLSIDLELIQAVPTRQNSLQNFQSFVQCCPVLRSEDDVTGVCVCVFVCVCVCACVCMCLCVCALYTSLLVVLLGPDASDRFHGRHALA